MPDTLNLRYRSSAGAVRVFVNGFLLINDLVGENSGTRLEPCVRPEKNALRLDASRAPKAKTMVEVVVAPDTGGPGETILAQLQLPDPGFPDGVAQTTFELPASTPIWGWTQLQPIPLGAEASVHRFLVSFAQHLQNGPDNELLNVLSYKHGEVGAAMTIGKSAMDLGLVEGLAARRRKPAFRVDVVAPSDLALVWSSDRSLVRPLRQNGYDAIMMFADGMWLGFELTLGFRNQWAVIR